MLGLLVWGSVALWIAILITPFLIRYFRQRELGQHISQHGPASHSVKAGSPTMGGIAIVAAAVFGYAIGHIGTGSASRAPATSPSGPWWRSASSDSSTTASR